MRLTRRLRGAVMARMGINNSDNVTPNTLYASVPFEQSIGTVADKQTINGAQGTTVLEYDAADLSGAATTWTARTGPTLSFGAFGVVPRINCPCPIPDSTKKLAQFTNGTSGQYLAGVSTGADLDTDDLVVTFYGCITIGNGGGTSAGRNILGKVASGGFTAGHWRLGATTTGGQIVFSMHIGGARFDLSAVVSQTTSNGNALIQVYIDRSDTTTGTGCALYANGKRLAVGTFTGAQAATLLNNSSKVCIGGAGGASATSSVMSGTFGYARIEKRANWFAGGAQNLTDWDAAAKLFASNVLGWTADVAPSSTVPTDYTGNTCTINLPTLHSDGSVQFASLSNAVDGVPIAYCPAYARRMLWTCDDSTNRALQGDTFTNATWVKTECTISASSTERSRYNGGDAAQFVASAVNTTHQVEQTAASMVAATYTQSVFIKPSASTVWKLSVGGDTTRQAYFTLSASAAMGATASGQNLGANISRAIARHWGGGWWRCEITHTTSSTTTQLMRIGPCASVGTDAFAGDGSTINGWLSCAQLEAMPYASHYMNTSSSVTTRTIDYQMSYPFAPDTQTEGKIEARIGVTTDQTAQSSTLGNGIFTIYNGNASPRFALFLSSAQKLRWQVRAAASAVLIADLTSTPSVTGVDGTPPTAQGTFATDDYKAAINGSALVSQSSGGTSTAGAVGNFTTNPSGSASFGCGNFPVGNFRIYTSPAL